MTRGRYALLACLLGLLPMLLPLSVDGSLSSLPATAAWFGSTTAAAQFSFTAVVLGIAVGQLVYGPLSDRFGRKPVILAGVALYAATSAVCAQADTIETLIGLRFLQGFFACSGVIVARAVIRDRFDREAGARLFALMMGIHGIMPTIAPGVSGWLVQSAGWHSVYYAMAGFGAATFVIMLAGLRESNDAPQLDALRPGRLLATYASILRDGTFRSYATCACFMYGALMAYFAGAPVGLIQYLGLEPAVFGIAMALPMAAYVISQITVARYAPRLGMNRMIAIGVTLASAAGIGMLGLVLADIVNLYTLIGPVVVVLISLSFITPSTTAGAMSPFRHSAGAASSLLGFIQFGAGAAATAIVGSLNDGTPLPMAAVICASVLCSLIAWALLVRPLHAPSP